MGTTVANYIIETEQLALRELTVEDFQTWHQILSEQETMQYYISAFDEDKTKSWIDWNLDNYSRYGFGLWAVILKETNQFIGDCDITMQNIHGDGNLFPEIGYHIDKQFWCKGYASQAAKACLRYIPSRKVAEKRVCHFARNMQTKKMIRQACIPLRELNFMQRHKRYNM